MHMCQTAETEGELIYVQDLRTETDIEASSSNAKLASIFSNYIAQRYYKYNFENAYSIYTSMQSAF